MNDTWQNPSTRKIWKAARGWGAIPTGSPRQGKLLSLSRRLSSRQLTEIPMSTQNLENVNVSA